MITENLSTLKIHKLSQEQYDKAVENGNVNANEIYLTPADDDIKKHNSSTDAHEDIRDEVDKVRDAFETIKSNNILDPENYEVGYWDENFNKMDNATRIRTVKPIQIWGRGSKFYIASNLTSDNNSNAEKDNLMIFQLDENGNFLTRNASVLSSYMDGTVQQFSTRSTCTQIHIYISGIDKRISFDNFCISETEITEYERYIEGEGVGELKEEYLPTSLKEEMESDKIYLEQKIEEGKTQYDIKSVEGVNPVINDGANTYFYGMNIYGKTEQKATTGKQLLPYPYPESTKTSAGITWTDNGDGSLTINGTSTGESYFNLKADGTGVVKGTCFLSGSIDGVTLYGRGEDGVAVYDSGNGALLPNGLVFLNLYISAGKTFNNITIYPMLNEGTTAIPWEPFTGGKASPNAEYSQELESKGKWGNLLDASILAPNNTQWVKQNDDSLLLSNRVDAGATNLGEITFPKGTYTACIYYENSNVVPCVILRNPSTLENYNSNYASNKNYFSVTFNEETRALLVIQAQSNANTFASVGCKVWITITEGREPLPSYRPYSGQKEIESVVCGKNLIPYPYKADVYTDGGITLYENYSDGRIVLDGTSTKRVQSVLNYLTLPKGDYILSQITDNANVGVYANIPRKSGTEYVDLYGKGNTEVMFSLEEETELSVVVDVRNTNTVLNKATVYAMIRKAEITDEIYVPYNKQSHISLVSDGLKGIPVTDSSLATYVDENGQMWCSDYIDLERGVLVQRIGSFVFDGTGTETWLKESTPTWYDSTFYFTAGSGPLTDNRFDNFNPNEALMMCNHFIARPRHLFERIGSDGYCCVSSNGRSMEFSSNLSTVEEWKAWLVEQYENGTPLIVHYILATPNEIPLSSAELASYRALKTRSLGTSVLNNCDAFMKIGYLDKKYDDGMIAVVEKSVGNAIGDISVALDELHAYAEALLGGAS